MGVISEFVEGFLNFAYKNVKFFRRTTFINYEIQFLMETYKNEKSIGKYIPYSELVKWIGKTKKETIENKKNISLKPNKHGLM